MLYELPDFIVNRHDHFSEVPATSWNKNHEIIILEIRGVRSLRDDLTKYFHFGDEGTEMQDEVAYTKSSSELVLESGAEVQDWFNPSFHCHRTLKPEVSSH